MHIERANERAKRFRILTHVLPSTLMHLTSSIIRVCFFLTNLMGPPSKAANYAEWARPPAEAAATVDAAVGAGAGAGVGAGVTSVAGASAGAPVVLSGAALMTMDEMEPMDEGDEAASVGEGEGKELEGGDEQGEEGQRMTAENSDEDEEASERSWQSDEGETGEEEGEEEEDMEGGGDEGVVHSLIGLAFSSDEEAGEANEPARMQINTALAPQQAAALRSSSTWGRVLSPPAARASTPRTPRGQASSAAPLDSGFASAIRDPSSQQPERRRRGDDNSPSVPRRSQRPKNSTRDSDFTY